MTTSEQDLNSGSGAAASDPAPMTAAEWQRLYDLLARATREAIGHEPENDWYVYSAAKLRAHANFLALAFPDEPEPADADDEPDDSATVLRSPETGDPVLGVGDRVRIFRGVREELTGYISLFERPLGAQRETLALVQLDEPEPGIGTQIAVPVTNLELIDDEALS